VSEDAAIAQIVTAIITVFYAVVFAIGYYLLIMVNRETLREMREQRISGVRRSPSRHATTACSRWISS